MFCIAPQTLLLPNMGSYGPVVIEIGKFFYNLDSRLFGHRYCLSIIYNKKRRSQVVYFPDLKSSKPHTSTMRYIHDVSHQELQESVNTLVLFHPCSSCCCANHSRNDISNSFRCVRSTRLYGGATSASQPARWSDG